jgi:hypothetical protein
VDNEAAEEADMAKRRAVVARRLFEFAPLLGGRPLVCVTVGPSLDPGLVSLKEPADYGVETDRGSVPKKHAARPNRFRLHHQTNRKWETFDLPATAENYHEVQPLPGGHWLMVRGQGGRVLHEAVRASEGGWG